MGDIFLGLGPVPWVIFFYGWDRNRLVDFFGLRHSEVDFPMLWGIGLRLSIRVSFTFGLHDDSTIFPQFLFVLTAIPFSETQ